MSGDDEVCSQHPCAPHGFNRNGSHSEDRYVCDCEGWRPDRTCAGLELLQRAETAEAALLAKSAAYEALVAGIDLNDHVMVKLNAHGLAILKAQHDSLRAAVPSVGEWNQPKTDSDGFSKHQLWCLFQDFGPHISLPARKPFDAMRLLVSDDRPSHTAGENDA